VEEASRVLHLPAPPSPVALVSTEPETVGSELDELGVQVSTDSVTQDESFADTVIEAPASVDSRTTTPEPAPTAEQHDAPPHAAATETVPHLEPLPPLPPLLANDNRPSEESATPPEADMAVLNSLALDALLERIMREHRFTWFQVQACEGCGLRRLMFGTYERERRLVVFTNVRQEPSLTLSVVDFDAGLKSTMTRPIYDEPALSRLLNGYIASSAASRADHP
jgi:hypothetical protein